jgi:hypothetical protein
MTQSPRKNNTIDMNQAMKLIPFAIKPLAALALAAFTAGCATQADLKSKESLAVAADFKVITPGKPDQKAILEKLPKDQVSRITYQGKTYYVLPDLAHNQAYVGGPKQYQAYQQLSQGRQQANDYQQAEKIHQQQNQYPTNWGGWGGWGSWENANGATLYSGNSVDDRRAAYGWY